jgi:hypothetical protein
MVSYDEREEQMRYIILAAITIALLSCAQPIVKDKCQGNLAYGGPEWRECFGMKQGREHDR